MSFDRDPNVEMEALMFHAGQEVARLLREIAARDAVITQLQQNKEGQVPYDNSDPTP